MTTVLSRRPFYRLAAVCERWGVDEADIANFAAADELTLSIIATSLQIEEGHVDSAGADDDDPNCVPERRYHFTGTLDLWPGDAWQVLKVGVHAVGGFKMPPARYRCVYKPFAEDDRIDVGKDLLVLRHAELTRFEAAQHADASSAEGGTRAGQRGPLPKFDWDEFYCACTVHIHLNGMPEVQAELTRFGVDWFAHRGQYPDRSTIKKKIALLWRRYHEAIARP